MVIQRATIKFTPFLITQTTKVVDRKAKLNEEHIRLSKSMIRSNAFNNLTANALRLYLELRMKFYKEEAKSEDFELSQTFACKLLGINENSKISGKRAIENLSHNGFIEPTYISKGGGKRQKISNRFKFSENWKYIE